MEKTKMELAIWEIKLIITCPNCKKKRDIFNDKDMNIELAIKEIGEEHNEIYGLQCKKCGEQTDYITI